MADDESGGNPEGGRPDGPGDDRLGPGDGRPPPAPRPTLVIAPDGRVYLRRVPAAVACGTTAAVADRAT